MRRLLGSILLSMVPFCWCFSQDEGFVFTRIDREMGLRSNAVNKIAKDHRGIIWIATESGLHWYDGQRMTAHVHNPDDSSSISDNDVRFVKEDKHLRLWVITRNGADLYDRVHNNFSRIAIDTTSEEDYRFGRIYEDLNGNIWLTSSRNGPYIYDSSTKRFRHYSSIWPKLQSQIYSLIQDQYTGLYWLTTFEGVMAYDPEKKTYYNYKNNPYNILCLNDTITRLMSTEIHINSNCELWIQGSLADKEYCYRYDTKKKELTKLNSPFFRTSGFFTDASGRTWLWGEHLSSYDPQTNSLTSITEKRNDRTGINFDAITGMIEDSENNLWISCNTGIYIFNPQQQEFRTVEITSEKYGELLERSFHGFIETKDSLIIVVGWEGDVLYFYDKNFRRLPYQYGFSLSGSKDENFSRVHCGIRDREGLIWLGCDHGRIMMIDPIKKTTKYLNPPECEGRSIRSIVEDEEGNIWFGTLRSVVVKWIRSENRFKQIIPVANYKYRIGTVGHMIRGYQNDIWATTFSSGVIRFDIRSDSVVQKLEGTSGLSGALDIALLNKDSLVIATGGNGIGIYDINKDQFSYITEKEGLPSDIVYGIIIDETRNIWFGTHNGIGKIRLPQKQVTNYGFRDGITDETHVYPSFLRTSSGKIVFAISQGFVYFDPAKTNVRRQTPDARITALSVFNNELSLDSIYQHGNRLRLEHNQNSITIRFSAMTFRMNDKLDFYYQLEGADKDWIKAGTLREINYSHLGSGNYLFKVKTISRDGVPSANIASLSIRIDPPFWNTWWFYLLVATAVVALLYGVHRIRVNRILAIEKVRRRVARDLHDDMGSTLSTINILSEMARMKINNDVPKVKEYIGKISDNSSRMMEAIDDIVWSINPMNDSMQKITARMREFATNTLEAKDINLEFKVDEGVNNLSLDMEARRDFFLIFKEAVNNAAKYSNCRNASIHISLKQQKLQLDVRDDGIGFDVNSADSGNGLANMKKRADALRGKITYISQPGKGTQISLTVPV